MIEQIRGAVATESGLTRAALSKKVCGWIDWTDRHGKAQDMSCRMALLKMAKRGIIELPTATRPSPSLRNKKSVEGAVVEIVTPQKIEIDLSELGDIELVYVRHSEQNAYPVDSP